MDLKIAGGLHRAGRLAEAEAAYRQILAAEPGNGRAMHLLGIALGQLGRVDESIGYLQRALALSPDSPDLLGNLAVALGKRDRHAEAAELLRKAIRLRPQYAEGHGNLGVALEHLGRWNESAAAYRQAIRLRPGSAETHCNLGNVLRKAGAYDEAARSYHQSLELNPQYGRALEGLAECMVDCGDADGASECYQKAVAIDPARPGLRSAMLYTVHYDARVGPQRLWEEHREWGRRYCDPTPRWAPPPSLVAARGEAGAGRRLRIGYVSGDFREHPIPRFIAAALKHHDRSAFELFCYSDVRADEADAVTAALKTMVENWRDTAGVPDDRIAEAVREDGIDVLVDLRGHAAGNRLLLFARRAAPVQVNMVGYFDTTGLTTMDWRVTDERQDPADPAGSRPGGGERFHTERLARLPGGCWCYAPDDDIGGGASPPVQDPPALRNGFVTFGSLNKIVKVSRPCAQLWAQLLAALPDARLMLPVPKGAVTSVRDRLAAAGIPAGRLAIANKTRGRLDYLRRFNEIDICLDPFPFNGITTTCDSLWMGVPVVSLAGATTISRAGRSILHGAGLAELAVDDPPAYVRAATALGGDMERLRELGRGMRARLAATPLLDQHRFTAELETAYRRMWSEHEGR